jgi:hypothetical protein
MLVFAGCSEPPPDQPSGDRLEVGEPAPNFELKSASGDDVSLDRLIEKRAVLLYFSMGPG